MCPLRSRSIALLIARGPVTGLPISPGDSRCRAARAPKASFAAYVGPTGQVSPTRRADSQTSCSSQLGPTFPRVQALRVRDFIDPDAHDLAAAPASIGRGR